MTSANEYGLSQKEFASYPSLVGRSVFVTGGATGIGATIVEAFARQGAKLACLDLDESAGEALADRLQKETGRAVYFDRVDVTDVAALQSAVQKAVTNNGPLDVLINSVGNDTRHKPESVTVESWRRGMAVNLDASFFACQAAHKTMRERGGSIINLSSINALLGPANMPTYVTAKAGILGLTRALARDYGDDAVRVNAVLPGWVVTERQLDSWLTPEAEAQWMEQVALKQRLLPIDVANLVLFLAADDSRMITGQSFTIDAGRT